MSNYRDLIPNLHKTLKELKRDMQYQGLKQYVRSLEQKSSLNGKEEFILRGSSAYLRRMRADRRSKSLGLTEYIPYDERQDKTEEIRGSYVSWDRSVCLFTKE